MTEAEWLMGDELWRMLHHIYQIGGFTIRNQFLYCIGACRFRGESLPEEYLPILDDLETFADSQDFPTLPVGMGFWEYQDEQAILLGACPFGDRLTTLKQRASEVMKSRFAALRNPGEPWWGEGSDPRFEVDEAITYACMGHPFACSNGNGHGSIAHSRREAGLLRDLVGNPFRPVAVDPSWLTSTVRLLAEGIYQERAFDRMPILADALQDAGCDNDDILNHCRQPGEHVRGCWVVDLLTGRK